MSFLTFINRKIILFLFREEKGFEQYKRLVVYVKPYLRLLVGALLCMMALGALNPLVLFLGKSVLGDVLIRKDHTQLLLLPFAIVIVSLLKGLADFGQKFLLRRTGQEVIRDLRRYLFEHIESLPLGYFQKQKTGEIMSRVLNDVSIIEQGITTVVSDLVKEPFVVLGILFFLFYMDWKLAAVAFVLLPITLAPIGVISQRLRRASKITQEMIADLTSVLQESITGISIVKAFSGEAHEMAKLEKANKEYLKQTLRAVRASSSSGPIMEFLGAGVAAVLIYIGGRAVISGATAPEDLMAFVAALFMMYAPFKKIGRVNHEVQRASIAAERIFEVMDLKREAPDAEGLLALPLHRLTLEFRDVTFSYGEGEPALQDINLVVRHGETIALVGSSGAGKSTFVNLIPRFFELTRGAILLDGTDIRKGSLSSLRSQIGVVSQEIILFNDTVRANIAYTVKNPDEERVQRAAKAAFCHDFIQELPQGYDTIIGERGITLSGGQRQRVSIARSIYKDPAILIFDEATSALDTESEQIVQKAIENLIHHRTTFVIAHRLSTIRNATRILVLENGRIVEEGTHEELMQHGKVYRHLYDLQFAGSA